MAQLKNRRAPAVAIAIGLLAMAVIVYWGLKRPPEFAVDDAFITYRYADNLRRGLGLVYNPGQSVLGTTTPLFALLLAAGGLVVTNLEVLGHWLGVAAWIAAAWGALALLWQEGRPTPAWQPGEEVHDLYEIELPADVAAGTYGLRVGWYDAHGRLPLADGGSDYWLIPDAISVEAP
jgi:hypothetical protein